MNISKKRMKEIDDIKDEAIDYSDIPELDSTFWNNAKLTKREKKKIVSIRLDADILDWFRAQGKGYQTMINSVLRTFVDARKK